MFIKKNQMKLPIIIICSFVALGFVFISCSKEPVTKRPIPGTSNPLNYSSPPLGVTPNPPNPPSSPSGSNFPADSLTGREFVFSNLSWTMDSIGSVCTINRPDLFYLLFRPMNVQLTAAGSDWMNVYTCPYPTDQFFFHWLEPGVLKFYVFNYTGRLTEGTTSIKVLFL